MLFRLFLLFFIVSSLFFSFFNLTSAERLESTNFIVPSDTVTPGEFSSSNSFRVFGNISEVFTGVNTSNNFDVSEGFLSFPEAAVAAVAAAAAETTTTTDTSAGQGIVLGLIQNFLVPRPLIPIPIKAGCDGGADINCDGKVDIKDLGAFLYFTPQKGPNPADLNKDNIVNSKDFGLLLSRWTERFVAFRPDRSQIPFKDSGIEAANLEKQQSNIPSETKKAEVNSNGSLVTKSKTGFSFLLQNIKNIIIKVFLTIKSIF